MATSLDHPELAYVQAENYTSGRPDGPPLWIVVHDMEAGEYSGRAESTAAYFADPSDGRTVSSHYCADDNSVVQCVRLRDSAWTVGNRPGNYRGINWEFSGFARQTRAEWLDAFGLAMFHQAAPIIRSDATKYNIPLTRRTVAELKAFKPGVTSHNDLRLAFGGTTHTDPGVNFPWDVFLQILGDDDVWTEAEKAKLLSRVENIYQAVFFGGSSCGTVVEPDNGRPKSNSLVNKSDALLERPPADATALAAALVADPTFTAALEAAAEKAVRKVAADAAE